MSTKPALIGSFLVLAIITVYLIADILVTTQKEAVEIALKKAIKYVEKEDMSILDILDSNFRYKNYRCNDIKANIGPFFDQFDKIRIEFADIRISLSETTAACSLKARVIAWTDSMPVLLLGEVLSKSPVAVNFIKQNNEWLIRGVDAD